MSLEWAEKCLAFIDKGVSCYHVIGNVEKQLKENGFKELKERDAWEILSGGSYYVKRGGSSLIAFRVPEAVPTGCKAVFGSGRNHRIRVRQKRNNFLNKSFNNCSFTNTWFSN